MLHAHRHRVLIAVGLALDNYCYRVRIQPRRVGQRHFFPDECKVCVFVAVCALYIVRPII